MVAKMRDNAPYARSPEIEIEREMITATRTATASLEDLQSLFKEWDTREDASNGGIQKEIFALISDVESLPPIEKIMFQMFASKKGTPDVRITPTVRLAQKKIIDFSRHVSEVQKLVAQATHTTPHVRNPLGGADSKQKLEQIVKDVQNYIDDALHPIRTVKSAAPDDCFSYENERGWTFFRRTLNIAELAFAFEFWRLLSPEQQARYIHRAQKEEEGKRAED